jgi:hypothetical protein
MRKAQMDRPDWNAVDLEQGCGGKDQHPDLRNNEPMNRSWAHYKVSNTFNISEL